MRVTIQQKMVAGGSSKDVLSVPKEPTILMLLQKAAHHVQMGKLLPRKEVLALTNAWLVTYKIHIFKFLTACKQRNVFNLHLQNFL